MAASVRIEDEAFSDDRYEDLATFAGLADSDHARGKMARLWRQCTIEQTHTLPAETVVRHLGADGVSALVRARLGVAMDGNMVRIRGTKGRIEWLKKLRDNGKFGARGGRPKKNPRGFAVGNPAAAADETPPAPAPAPAPAQENTFSAAPPVPAKPKARAASKTALPADWQPNDAHTVKAREKRLDLRHEAEQFRNNALASARLYASWDAAFHTWLGNAAKWRDERGGGGQRGLQLVGGIRRSEEL